MGLKKIAAFLVAGALFVTLAAPGMAMDARDRIWVRDTLIGGGVGLAVGLINDNSSTGSLFLAGLIIGGIVGYFDSQKGWTAYESPDLRITALSGMTVDALHVEGKAEPVPVLKATLLSASW